MSLELSPEIEYAVRERAAVEGVSVNDLLARTFAPERQAPIPVRDPKAHVQALLDRWQAEDKTPVMPPIPTRLGETATLALFRKWKAEDAHMTDEEKEAEDRLWEEIEQGLKKNRLTLGTGQPASMIIILDTFPTSSVSKRAGKKLSLSDRCQQWIDACEDTGHTILVPAISYYEALRELEQRQATSQILRLKEFCLLPTRFLPLTTAHLETAAQLWGQARRGGQPTASDDALDADILIAAQALSLGLSLADYIVATTNVSHMSRFVPCEDWVNFKQ